MSVILDSFSINLLISFFIYSFLEFRRPTNPFAGIQRTRHAAQRN